MKIIQQPDILSFAGNMNDFVIEDVAKSLVFKLSVDGMVIVDEVYVAEGGEVRVSMKDIVDCFLSISIPRADSDYIIQSLAVKKFKAEIEDSVIEFTVVKGGNIKRGGEFRRVFKNAMVDITTSGEKNRDASTGILVILRDGGVFNKNDSLFPGWISE